MQRGEDRRQRFLGDGAIDQQRLGRAADAGAAHLRVRDDAQRLLEIGGAIDIDVAIAFEMRDHRNAAFALHALDQRFAAARHDDVDEFGHGQHHADRGAIDRRHELHGSGGQACRGDAGLQGRRDGARGMKAFRAAAQDCGIAGPQAQPAGIGGHVGPRFIDDADHAQAARARARCRGRSAASSAPARCRSDRAARRPPRGPWPSRRRASRRATADRVIAGDRSFAAAISGRWRRGWRFALIADRLRRCVQGCGFLRRIGVRQRRRGLARGGAERLHLGSDAWA